MNSYFTKIRRFIPLLFILSFALLLRVSIAIYFEPPQVTDEKEYLAIAKSLQNGNGFSIDNRSTAYRAPAYPSLIAASFTIFGESITVFRIIQAFADTISCLFIFLIANRFFSKRTAYVSIILYAVFPGNAFYVSLLLSEIFFTTVFLCIIFLYTTDSVRDSFRWKVLIGFIFAILTLLRQNAPVLIFALIIWELLQFKSWKIVCQRNILIVISFIIFLMPWMIRNKFQFDHFSLTSNGGVNFWIGHNTHANGSYRYISENNPLESVTGEFDKSLAGYKEGFTFLMQNPLKEVKLIGLKFAHFFEPDFALQYSLQFNSEWIEYSNSIRIYREFSPISLMLFHSISIIIILSALWTLVYSNEINNQFILLCIVVICFWIVVHLVFFGTARFRIPIMPLFIIASAYTVELIRKKQYSITKNKNIIFASIFSALVGSWMTIFIILYLPH